uniref:Uncharacterized protein n=1 Tax=Setaria digitata TaxID=48799 RepID=A0A915Q582_9BILA
MTPANVSPKGLCKGGGLEGVLSNQCDTAAAGRSLTVPSLDCVPTCGLGHECSVEVLVAHLTLQNL